MVVAVIAAFFIMHGFSSTQPVSEVMLEFMASLAEFTGDFQSE